MSMKYGLDVSTAGEYCNPRTLADLAVEAEEAGWDGFFVWDAVFAIPPDLPMADPWVALTAIATKTHRICLGAMVTPLARRRPWKVARETVSLDHLSNGRLILGVGLGYQALDFAAFGEEADARLRADKIDESLDILSGLWTGELFSFGGKHYQINEVRFLPKPVQSPRIPVWVAGYWPNHRPFRRAARWDGVLPGKVGDEELTPEDLREIISYVVAHRTSVDPFAVAVYGQTPSDPRKGAEMVQPYIEAGATWWREGIDGSRGPIEAMRKRILSGPPRR